MKTTISNGTVIEVGKKYRTYLLSGDEYIEVLDIGVTKIWAINDKGNKYSYPLENGWLSYEEPQPNPFEKYQKWYIHYTVDNTKRI